MIPGPGEPILGHPMNPDLFIPAHEKDFPVLPNAIRSILDFAEPRPRSVTIIAATPSIGLQAILKPLGAHFLHEDTIVTGLPRARMPCIRVRWEDRSGWYFQQFLKWVLALQSNQNHYLVADADTLWIRPTHLRDMGRTVHYGTGQHHLPYFETYQKLLGYRPDRQASFIANFMLFETAIVRELIGLIQHRTGLNWVEALLANIDRSTLSSFSEYETYGYYSSRAHPEASLRRNGATLNLHALLYRFHDCFSWLARGSFHSIAYHNYRR